MAYQLSREQRRRCADQWDAQGAFGPVIVRTDWGWVEGDWTESMTFTPGFIVVRDPGHSRWFERALTQPALQYRSHAIPRPFSIGTALQFGLGTVGWMLLMPTLGFGWSGGVAAACTAAVALIVRIVRARWLRAVPVIPGEHGWQLLAASDGIDHSVLWSACLEPELVAELPSYDVDSESAGAVYESYPFASADLLQGGGDKEWRP